MDIDEKQFDEAYGKGTFEAALYIINALAPMTRRDSWWETDGPYDAVGEQLKRFLEWRDKL